jgi:hypothetical protein
MAQEAKVTAIIEAKDNASGPLSAIGGNFASFGLKVAGVGAALVIAKKAFDAIVDASSDAQVKIASMDATLKATGKSSDAIRSQILAASNSFVKLGFDDEEAAKSMALLFQRTEDATQAIKLTTLAADLARAKQIDLESATKLVTLALSGSGRALLQYGIQIKDSATPLEALATLQQAVGGQAAAFAQTYKGQQDVLMESWQNFLQFFGDKVLPELTRGLGGVILVVSNLVDSVGALWARVVEFAQSTGLVDLFRASWDSVSATFRENLQPALDKLWVALQPLMPFFKAMGTILGAVLVGAIVLLTDVLTALINGFVLILTVSTNVATFFTKTLGSAISFVTDQIANLINYVKQAIEWLGKLSLSSVAGSIGSAVSGAVKGPYKIPGFADGGTVPGPVGAPLLAVVHGGERVIPVGGNGGGTGAITINTYVTGNNIDSDVDIRDLTGRVSENIMRELRRIQMI